MKNRLVVEIEGSGSSRVDSEKIASALKVAKIEGVVFRPSMYGQGSVEREALFSMDVKNAVAAIKVEKVPPTPPVDDFRTVDLRPNARTAR
jgi:hypothetical protein